MKATEQLRAEHEGILTMLKILDKISAQMAAGKNADLNHLENIIEFLTVFADQCHHGKEEDILFPALEKAGIPRVGGPIGVMLNDHDHGREHIRAMRNALGQLKEDRGGAQDFVKAVARYTELLRNHILKENNVLFVMAEQRFSEKEQTRLYEEFETMEREKIGIGKHESFHRLMEELRALYLQ